MQHDPDDLGFFSLATFQTLRIEALDLFDRCLAERKPELLERFLQRQIAQNAPSLELLSQIAEDIHQRLLGLRQRHFEVQDEIRWKIQHQYGIDVAALASAELVEYRHLLLEDVQDPCGCDRLHLTAERCAALRLLLQEAQQSVAALHADVLLAEHLYNYVIDWVLALHIVSVRGAWTDIDWDENAIIH